MYTLELIDDTGILTINNPPQNYLNKPAFISKIQLIEFIKDNNLKGFIINGFGRHFSAGADLTELREMVKNDHLTKEMQQGIELLNYIRNLEIPVIAAIEGVCFGGGLEIALSSHIRFASEKSLFAFPEVNQNIIPGMGGIGYLSEKMTADQVLDIVLRGDLISASEALKIRLIDKVFESKTVLEHALSFIRSITANRPPEVIKAVMRCINFGRTNDLDASLQFETEEFIKLARIAFNG